MVPLDGSKAAEVALPWAAYLAKAFQAEIVLFHAIEKNPPEQIHGEAHLANTEEADAYLGRVAVALRAVCGGSCTISIHVHIEETTDVAASIATHMRELAPDLVVMCTHGRSSFTQAFIGSLATRVIGLGQVPVFLVKASEKSWPAETLAGGFGAVLAEITEKASLGTVAEPSIGDASRNVLPAELPGGPQGAPRVESNVALPSIADIIVPLDNASVHDKAIAPAEELTSATGAKLLLLAVVPRFSSLKGRDGGWGIMAPATSAALLDIEEDKMREHLATHRRELSARGVASSAAVIRGDPARKIACESKRRAPSLVVLGTHGRSGLDAFWKGSVAAKVVSLSDGPVLLVPLRE